MKRLIMLAAIIIIIIIATSICLLLLNKTNESISEKEKEKSMNEKIIKLNVTIDQTNYTATLEDNETTREFVKRLPLEITMSELNGNEKYYYMEKSLPTNSSRVNTIENGDIMLYGNDCLVIFYDSFSTSYSYTRMGKIDNPAMLKNIVGKDNVEVKINKERKKE